MRSELVNGRGWRNIRSLEQQPQQRSLARAQTAHDLKFAIIPIEWHEKCLRSLFLFSLLKKKEEPTMRLKVGGFRVLR
jgi:hypothetical protein